MGTKTDGSAAALDHPVVCTRRTVSGRLPSTIGSARSRARHGPHRPFDRRFPAQPGCASTPASGPLWVPSKPRGRSR